MESPTVNLIRFCVSAVATGLYFFAGIWALADMQSRRRKTILTNSFFVVNAIVIFLIGLLELIEFFLIYDFIYYKSVDWQLHGQWLAFFVEYMRLLQLCSLLALGVHQTLSITQTHCWHLGFVATNILYTVNFVFICFLLPTVSLSITVHFDAVSIDHIVPTTLVSFTLALLVFSLLLLMARKQLLSLGQPDILATKVILVMLLLIIWQSVVDLILIFSSPYGPAGSFINTLEDIFRPLYPTVYLLLFRFSMAADKIFSPCLNSKDGAQRLTSEEVELQSAGQSITLGFPPGVFGIVEE